MTREGAEEPDSRHGWVVAFVGAIAMVFTFGTPVSYGILRDPLSETFAVSPIALSVVFSLMLFTFFIGSGLVGVFGVRFPARTVLLTCAGVTGVLSPSLYLVDTLAGLLFVFAVLGVALGTVFVLVASVIPRWFEERRGAATGLIFTGNGIGLFLLPPAWQYALAEFGVERGFFLIVAVTAVSFLLAGLVCRRPNWAEQSTATTDEILVWLRELGGTRTFQLLIVGVALAFAWYQLLAAYATDLFIYRGLSASAASSMFGLIGGFSIISRVGGGYLSDRMGPRRSFLASLLCVTAGVVLLFVPNVPVMVVAVFLLGLGLGGTATIYLPLIMSVYSPEKDTAIVGVFNVGGGAAALAMPPLGTASVALTDGYTLAILLTLIVTVGGTWLIAAGTR